MDSQYRIFESGHVSEHVAARSAARETGHAKPSGRPINHRNIGRVEQSFEYDVTLRDEGSLILVTPNTPRATMWLEEHTSGDATYFGPFLVVEHRYIADLITGMINAGLELSSHA